MDAAAAAAAMQHHHHQQQQHHHPHVAAAAAAAAAAGGAHVHHHPQLSLPHPATALTSVHHHHAAAVAAAAAAHAVHAGLPHFLPSPALASPVGSSSSSSQPGVGGAGGAAGACTTNTVVSAGAVGNAGNNAPCSTLFVANLGQFVSEHELKEIFASFPGFCRLRMHSRGGAPVAFIEYQDVRSAARVMAGLQGSFLLSSDRGPIRIEFAKSKMAAEVSVMVCRDQKERKLDNLSAYMPLSA